MSVDGRFVLLSSKHSHVVRGQIDPEDYADQFVVDRATGLARLVTLTGDDVTATGCASAVNVATNGGTSGYGSSVVFHNDVDGQIPGFDPLGINQAYQYEVSTTQLCTTTPNSAGQGALLSLGGSEVAAANLFLVSVRGLPAQSYGLMLASMDTGFLANPGGSIGNLCINGPSLGRYVGALQNSGTADRAVR